MKFQRWLSRSRFSEQRLSRTRRQWVREAEDSLSWKRRQAGNLSKAAGFSELYGRWRKIAVCKGRARRSETISGVAEVVLLLWKYRSLSARL